MALTSDRIHALASKKGVRGIAVSNFLSSLGGSSLSDALMNLEMDAQSYRWNTATISAIRTGILEHFRGGGAAPSGLSLASQRELMRISNPARAAQMSRDIESGAHIAQREVVPPGATHFQDGTPLPPHLVPPKRARVTRSRHRRRRTCRSARTGRYTKC